MAAAASAGTRFRASRKPLLTKPSDATSWNAFPTIDYTSLPVHERAQRVYRDGPSTASRVLPYWLAAIIDQLLFVVLPALAIPFAILKTVPAIFGVRYSMKSLQLSRRMVSIERRLIAGEDPEALMKLLRGIGEESATMSVPPPRAAQYLELRQNIHDARGRLEAAQDGKTGN